MFTWRGFMIMKGTAPSRKRSMNRRWRSRRTRGGAASRAKGTRCFRQREAGGAAINCVSLDRSARIRRRREKEQTGSPGIVPLQKKDEIEGEFDRRNTYAKKLESVFTNIGGCRIAAWLLRNGGGAGQPGLAK